MNESERMTKLFDDLYNGSPWLEVTILPTLQRLTGKQAGTRLYENWNTIFEITNHLISWRENVLQRVQGKMMITPSNNYIVPVTDISHEAWQNTLKKLEQSQQNWVQFLNTFNTADFEKKYPGNGMSYYEHIHGILQHDAYHLGQIVIMAKRVIS